MIHIANTNTNKAVLSVLRFVQVSLDRVISVFTVGYRNKAAGAEQMFFSHFRAVRIGIGEDLYLSFRVKCKRAVNPNEASEKTVVKQGVAVPVNPGQTQAYAQL